MKTKKQTYIPPAIEVIQVENEGILAGSTGTGNNLPGMPGNDGWINNRSASRNAMQSASPLQEIEDLINDILTVKK